MLDRGHIGVHLGKKEREKRRGSYKKIYRERILYLVFLAIIIGTKKIVVINSNIHYSGYLNNVHINALEKRKIYGYKDVLSDPHQPVCHSSGTNLVSRMNDHTPSKNSW